MLSPSFECVAVNTQPTERANSTYIQPQPAALSEYVVGGFQPNTVREYEVSEYVAGQAGSSTNNDDTRTATTAVTVSTTAPSTNKPSTSNATTSSSTTPTTAVAVATQAPSTNRPSTSNATTSSGTTHGHRSPHPHPLVESSTVVMEPPPEVLILRCYSMEKHPKLSRSAIRDAVYGGKISLPPCFIRYLQYIYAFYTYKIVLFKITPLAQPSLEEIDDDPSEVFCGALDYEAPENQCYLPPWMMRQLKLYDGYPVRIEHICNLKIGTFARFKPILSKRVLTIINDENIKKVRHVLEVQLSKYQCLSVGDEIAIEYNKDELRFRVTALEPKSLVDITNCDLKADFEDYELLTETAIFDEHKKEPEIDEDYKPGQLTFMRREGYKAHKLVKEMEKLNNTNNNPPKPKDNDVKKSGFSGIGFKLGKKPK
uniref:Ubiquitin fusion degradation protein 1 n=1 Tax=Meloidogyne incognita TaxID=6306 RepID=A0A914LT67_MELIC